MKLKFFATTIALWFSASAFAQNASVNWDQTFRQDGKFYVVVGVLTIIFTGIVSYLVWQDRRIRKLEKEIQD